MVPKLEIIITNWSVHGVSTRRLKDGLQWYQGRKFLNLIQHDYDLWCLCEVSLATDIEKMKIENKKICINRAPREEENILAHGCLQTIDICITSSSQWKRLMDIGNLNNSLGGEVQNFRVQISTPTNSTCISAILKPFLETWSFDTLLSAQRSYLTFYPKTKHGNEMRITKGKTYEFL